ncbi:uncharacterized protein [Apostichopus japonicus]|uniref:uncharacterized protein n=1 Tax=Stichopus japonicus TaxID=307972 RepID=UPI003AB84A45
MASNVTDERLPVALEWVRLTSCFINENRLTDETKKESVRKLNRLKREWNTILQQVLLATSKENYPETEGGDVGRSNQGAPELDIDKLYTDLETNRKDFLAVFRKFTDKEYDACALYHVFQKCGFTKPKKFETRSSTKHSIEFFTDYSEEYVYRVPFSIPEIKRNKKKTVTNSDNNAWKAEEIVSESIRAWGETCGNLHMFIFSDFKYSYQLYNVNEKKNGEHDVVVICKQLGIIFVQVKGITVKPKKFSTTRHNVKDAAEQLYRDVMAFAVISRELANFPFSNIPIWGFIALPCVETEQILRLASLDASETDNGIPVCRDHNNIILGKTQIESKSWLNGLLHECNKHPIMWSHEQFLKISELFVKNSTLCTSLEKTCRNTFGTKARLYLSPAQAQVVRRRHKCLAITGDFGTGKTFLLTHMAQNDALEGLGTYIISCAELNKFLNFNPTFMELPLVSYLKQSIRDIHKEKVDIKSITHLYKQTLTNEIASNVVKFTGDIFIKVFDFLLKLKRNKAESSSSDTNKKTEVNIFVDEMPLSLFQLIKQQIVERCSQPGSGIAKVWISLATETCYKDTVADSENFPAVYLTKNMRNPPVISRLMEAICKYTGDICKSPQRSNHASHGNDNHKDNLTENVRQTDSQVGNEAGNQNSCQTTIQDSDLPSNRGDDPTQSEDSNREDQAVTYQQFNQSEYQESNENRVPSTPSEAKALLYKIENITCTCTEDDCKCKCVRKCECESALCEYLSQRISDVIKRILQDQDFYKVKDKIPHIVFMVSHIFNRSFKSDLFTNIKSVINEALKNVNIGSFSWLTVANAAFEEPKESSRSEHLIVDENTYSGCENDRLIFIDLLSMWQWLPNKPSGSTSVMFLSRCTCKYVHVILPPGETKRLLEAHKKMFQDEIEKLKSDDLRMKGFKREIEKFDSFIQNEGRILPVLLKSKLLEEK